MEKHPIQTSQNLSFQKCEKSTCLSTIKHINTCKLMAPPNLLPREDRKCLKVSLKILSEVLQDNKISMMPSIAQLKHLTLRIICAQASTLYIRYSKIEMYRNMRQRMALQGVLALRDRRTPPFGISIALVSTSQKSTIRTRTSSWLTRSYSSMVRLTMPTAIKRWTRTKSSWGITTRTIYRACELRNQMKGWKKSPIDNK